jgi:hypothetical protein
MASFMSTTEVTVAVMQFSTIEGANGLSMVSVTSCVPVLRTRWSTVSLLRPNWVRMKAGVLLSLTARASEKTTSSAVSGLPEWNLRFWRILKT